MSKPETSSGARRPRGALLQPVAEIWLWIRSVGGRRWSYAFGHSVVESETPPFYNQISHLQRDNNRRAVRLGRYTVEKISTVPNGKLSRVRNPTWRVIPKACLSVFQTTRNAQMKVWYSEPWCSINKSSSWRKSYPGDNWIVASKSTHRPRCLLLRCRLSPSRVCRSTQRLGCSSIKGERELGLERRETVWRYLLEVLDIWGEDPSSTRGTMGRGLWCISCLLRQAE